jgi:hypothetical protein
MVFSLGLIYEVNPDQAIGHPIDLSGTTFYQGIKNPHFLELQIPAKGSPLSNFLEAL